MGTVWLRILINLASSHFTAIAVFITEKMMYMCSQRKGLNWWKLRMIFAYVKDMHQFLNNILGKAM